MAHIQKILVPVDPSPCSIAALTHATALAQDLAADLDVLHVEVVRERNLTPTTGAVPHVLQLLEQEMEAAISRADTTLHGRVTRRSEWGEPVRKILETAAHGRYDLIVMGTHGRLGRMQSLLGSVAQDVVRNAPCPVLTVREPGGEAETFDERRHGTSSLADQIRSH